MAIQDLTTYEDPFYTITIPLDGKDYVFDFRYNQREQVWYFSIEQPDGVRLATGVKVVCNTPLIYKRDERLPPGLLVAISQDGDDTSPSLLELGPGKRVVLSYLTGDEVVL
jgi:hypothetical protein